MSRRTAREDIFKILFEAEMRETSLVDIYFKYIEREDSTKIGDKEKKFIEKYIKGIDERKEEVTLLIKEKMEGWSLERIGVVEKSLLKFSVYELLFEETPKEIVINEAIELAKKYGDLKSHEFLNGVLAKIL